MKSPYMQSNSVKSSLGPLSLYHMRLKSLLITQFARGSQNFENVPTYFSKVTKDLGPVSAMFSYIPFSFRFAKKEFQS